MFNTLIIPSSQQLAYSYEIDGMTVIKPAFLNPPATTPSTEPREDSRVREALRSPFPRASPQIPARDFRRGPPPIRGLSYLPRVLGSPRAQGLPGEAGSPGRQGQPPLPPSSPREPSKARSPAWMPSRASSSPYTHSHPASSSVPGCPSRPGNSHPGLGLPGAEPPSVHVWSPWVPLTVLPEPRIQRVSLQRVLGVGGFSL